MQNLLLPTKIKKGDELSVIRLLANILDNFYFSITTRSVQTLSLAINLTK